jgi:hypothetical protein
VEKAKKREKRPLFSCLYHLYPSLMDKTGKDRSKEKNKMKICISLGIECPRVLSAALFFLLRSEIVLDIESLADLLRSLALDHVGDGKAGKI